MSKEAFEKFINPKPKNGVIREQIRQEKKKAKQEKKAFFEGLKEKKAKDKIARSKF